MKAWERKGSDEQLCELAEVRPARGFTQLQIADRMGVTKGRSRRSNVERSPDRTS
jgi:transcriptional regulator with XRE-family HTH domain